MQIQSLSYVRIQTQQPEAWRQLGEQVLGFTAEAAGKDLRLRMDAAPFRYLVEPGEDRFLAAGWECKPAEFESLQAQLQSAGVPVEEAPPEECKRREVAAFFTAKDPSGNAFEVCHTRAPGPAFASPIDGVEFLTGKMGMGHVVLPAAPFTETSRFYQEQLGFALSDDLTLPPPAEGAPEMRVHFLHADNPRHHSLGLFDGPAPPSGVVHVMAELTTLDAVGACLDRVEAAGHPLTATLGRHINDNMVSFYFLAPAGIPIEVGYDGKQCDWTTVQPTQSAVGDHWGHKYNFPTPS